MGSSGGGGGGVTAGPTAQVLYAHPCARWARTRSARRRRTARAAAAAAAAAAASGGGVRLAGWVGPGRAGIGSRIGWNGGLAPSPRG